MFRNLLDGTADPRTESPSASPHNYQQHLALSTIYYVKPFYISTTETTHSTCKFSTTSGRHCRSTSNPPPLHAPFYISTFTSLCSSSPKQLQYPPCTAIQQGTCPSSCLQTYSPCTTSNHSTFLPLIYCR